MLGNKNKYVFTAGCLVSHRYLLQYNFIFLISSSVQSYMYSTTNKRSVPAKKVEDHLQACPSYRPENTTKNPVNESEPKPHKKCLPMLADLYVFNTTCYLVLWPMDPSNKQKHKKYIQISMAKTIHFQSFNFL